MRSFVFQNKTKNKYLKKLLFVNSRFQNQNKKNDNMFLQFLKKKKSNFDIVNWHNLLEVILTKTLSEGPQNKLLKNK